MLVEGFTPISRTLAELIVGFDHATIGLLPHPWSGVVNTHYLASFGNGICHKFDRNLHLAKLPLAGKCSRNLTNLCRRICPQKRRRNRSGSQDL